MTRAKRQKSIQPVDRLRVQLDLAGSHRDVGTLVWSHKALRARFQYDKDFLGSNLKLSPFRLPLQLEVVEAAWQPFEGLHGLFNDSLPDGWGRRLLDRALQSRSVDYRSLTAIDRLAFVGARGMGALTYLPDNSIQDLSQDRLDLDRLAHEAAAFDGEHDSTAIDELEAVNGGSAGVRPKAMVGLSKDGKRVIYDDGQPLRDGYEHWLVKFKASNDSRDIGQVEYAYSLMAQDAGLDMPQTRLLKTKKGGKYFAVKRFDRGPEGRMHVHTLSGLLNADHATASVDYEALLKLTHILTQTKPDVLEMFRRMVFNVYAQNRDDHAKNHAFIMNADGAWRPSPAYDLTLSDGLAGEHNLTVNGQGKPGRRHIMQTAEGAGIAKGVSEEIIDQVRGAIKNWEIHAAKAELSDKRIAEIAKLLRKGDGVIEDKPAEGSRAPARK